MIRKMLVLVASAVALSACGPNPDAPSARVPSDTMPVQLKGRPEITVHNIVRDIIGQQVNIPAASRGAADMVWTFEENEPKKVEILERHGTGDTLELIIQMTTSGAPGTDARDGGTGRHQGIRK